MILINGFLEADCAIKAYDKVKSLHNLNCIYIHIRKIKESTYRYSAKFEEECDKIPSPCSHFTGIKADNIRYLRR